jgi:hypothetical protein
MDRHARIASGDAVAAVRGLSERSRTVTGSDE